MLCKHFHRAQGGQCAVLQNAKTRLQNRKMAIFKQGRQKSYKSAHHTSTERERDRERELRKSEDGQLLTLKKFQNLITMFRSKTFFSYNNFE